MSNTITLSSDCSSSSVPVIPQSQLIYVLLELLPDELAAQRRLPLNFSLVLDVSGSMAGEKINTVKRAVKAIIERLQADDVVAVVTFGSHSKVITKSQTVTAKEALKKQIDQIEIRGSTNMADGIKEGIAQVKQQKSNDRANRIILLTDGLPDSEDDALKQSQRAGDEEIPLLCLGFGEGWNEEFLQMVADQSINAPHTNTGSVEFISSPSKAAEIFDDVYHSMQTVTRDTTLTIKLVQGIEVRRFWQVSPTINDITDQSIQGQSLIVNVGQLEQSGQAYLAEMMLPPRPAGVVRIARTAVEFEIPGQEPAQVTEDVVINYTNDHQLARQHNEKVMTWVERLQAYKLQTSALQEEQAGNIGNATRKLRQAVTILLNQGQHELAAQMQQEADQMEETGQMSDLGKKTIRISGRKTVRLTGE